MYTKFNYRTKKALREAVKSGETPQLMAAGPFDDPHKTGQAHVEGPHFPEAHVWYAYVECVEGKIVKVLS